MPRARAADSDDPVWTRSSREGRRKRRPWPAMIIVGAAIPTLLWAANYTSWGWLTTAYIFVVLDFYIGVVVLVTLSLTVMAGLASTDRVLLKIRHRVLFQAAHRVTAIIAVVALGVHICVKVLEAHASMGDAVLPFFSQGRSLFIGFGTIAAYLLLAACWSGMARTRFIGSRRRWMWRLVHCSAYLSWPIALVHGLEAGRAAAGWVTVSYIVCVVLVSLGLLVRLFSRFGRYATGVKPTSRAIGVNVQTAVIPRIHDATDPGRPVATAATGAPVPAHQAQFAFAPAPEYGPHPAYAATGPAVADYQPDRERPVAAPANPGRRRLRLVVDGEATPDEAYRYAPTSDGWTPPAPGPTYRSRQRQRRVGPGER